MTTLIRSWMQGPEEPGREEERLGEPRGGLTMNFQPGEDNCGVQISMGEPDGQEVWAEGQG
jgi:hypothetical protein